MTIGIYEGKLDQMRMSIRKQWSRFTDADLDQVCGYHDRLTRLLQEKYGYGREAAEHILEAFEQRENIKQNNFTLAFQA
jgi:uncharacterized protein YjbJ (UPF0337 family)